jgi:hypothetical protein
MMPTTSQQQTISSRAPLQRGRGHRKKQVTEGELTQVAESLA